jgi:hypothetical protein
MVLCVPLGALFAPAGLQDAAGAPLISQSAPEPDRAVPSRQGQATATPLPVGPGASPQQPAPVMAPDALAGLLRTTPVAEVELPASFVADRLEIELPLADSVAVLVVRSTSNAPSRWTAISYAVLPSEAEARSAFRDELGGIPAEGVVRVLRRFTPVMPAGEAECLTWALEREELRELLPEMTSCVALVDNVLIFTNTMFGLMGPLEATDVAALTQAGVAHLLRVRVQAGTR